jgi:hypothetical protein
MIIEYPFVLCGKGVSTRIVKAYWISLYHRLLESLARTRASLLLRRLDLLPAARSQARILLGLVHRARNTLFGRNHDFHRIRSPGDFRRLVPVYTLADLHRDYWQPANGQLDRVTWPGSATHLVNPTGAPFTAALGQAYQAVVNTGLALAASGGSRLRLFTGRLLYAPSPTPGPGALQPCLVQPRQLSLAKGVVVGNDLAWFNRLKREPVSCLAGSPTGIMDLVQRLEAPVQQIWPSLRVLLSLEDGTPLPEVPATLLGQQGKVLRLIFRPEGAVALTDPRHGRLRLLTDHGLYFEFIPEHLRGEVNPPRVGIDQVDKAKPYEVVLSSPAGVWACRTGLIVTLGSSSSPLLESLHYQPIPPRFLPLSNGPVRALPPQPGPRNVDTPEALPGIFGHSPWLVPVDRG